jgi:hypothetical protein
MKQPAPVYIVFAYMDLGNGVRTARLALLISVVMGRGVNVLSHVTKDISVQILFSSIKKSLLIRSRASSHLLFNYPLFQTAFETDRNLLNSFKLS